MSHFVRKEFVPHIVRRSRVRPEWVSTEAFYWFAAYHNDTGIAALQTNDGSVRLTQVKKGLYVTNSSYKNLPKWLKEALEELDDSE